MFESYKRAVDDIKVSEGLEKETIKLMMDKADGKANNARILRGNRKKYGLGLIACLLLVALGTTIFYREYILSNNKAKPRVKDFKFYGSEASVKGQSKAVKEYASDSVQGRVLKETPISFDGSALSDRLAPKYRNIKERYANSENVIKGYVYSTEYFWRNSEVFSDIYTRSVIVVEKSYKGKLKPGERFTIIESGGITTLRDWIENTSSKEKKDFENIPKNYDPYGGKDPNTLVEYAGYFGIKPMRPAQEVVLFLIPYKYEFYGKNAEPDYAMVESDGGKMVLEDGRYLTEISLDSKGFLEDESCGEKEIDNLIKAARGDE